MFAYKLFLRLTPEYLIFRNIPTLEMHLNEVVFRVFENATLYSRDIFNFFEKVLHMLCYDHERSLQQYFDLPSLYIRWENKIMLSYTLCVNIMFKMWKVSLYKPRSIHSLIWKITQIKTRKGQMSWLWWERILFLSCSSE